MYRNTVELKTRRTKGRTSELTRRSRTRAVYRRMDNHRYIYRICLHDCLYMCVCVRVSVRVCACECVRMRINMRAILYIFACVRACMPTHLHILYPCQKKPPIFPHVYFSPATCGRAARWIKSYSLNRTPLRYKRAGSKSQPHFGSPFDSSDATSAPRL